MRSAGCLVVLVGAVSLLAMFAAAQRPVGRGRAKPTPPVRARDRDRDPKQPRRDEKGDPVSYEGCSVYRVHAREQNQFDILRRLREDQKNPLDLDFWQLPGGPGELPADVMACNENKDAFTRQMKENGIETEFFVEDVQQQIAEEAQLNKKALAVGPIGSYLSHDRINAYLQYLAGGWSSVASVIDIGSSYYFRRMKVIKIAKNDGKNRQAIFVEAGIHAREWISPASMLYVIDRLVRFNGHPDSAAMLERFDWYFLPVTNPDGYEWSRSTDRLWRKNRRWNQDTSCRGVDLNRNWAAGFGGTGSSGFKCQETYRGTAAFSEYESRRIRDFINSFPDNHFRMYMAVHSYSQLWLTPYAYTYTNPSDDADMIEAADVGVSSILATHGKVYVVEHGHDLYIASGVSMDWAKATKGIKYAYTMELRTCCWPEAGSAGFILPPSEIIPTGQEMFNAFRDVSEKIHACFSPKSQVLLESGVTKIIADLALGDRVQATDASGHIIFSDVISFLDYNTDTPTQFLQIETDTGKTLTLTSEHLVFTGPRYDEAAAVFAGDLRTGDLVLTGGGGGGGEMERAVVTRISGTVERGYVAPLTSAGTIVVDGVAASCYAAYPSHTLSHVALLPLRVWHSVKASLQWVWQGSLDDDFSGIHPYALFAHSTASYFGMI